MGKARRGRVAFSIIVGVLSGGIIASCGSTSPSKSSGNDDEPLGGDIGDEGGAGNGAGPSAGSTSGGRGGLGRGGNAGFAGRGPVAGSGGQGPITAGSGGGGTSGSPSGGMPACLEGIPCKCEDDSVGVTECSKEGESSCACPPIEECTPDEDAEATCFEACGGEPFGAWVVEETCFLGGGGGGNGGCQQNVRASSEATDLRLRILDGGYVDIIGTEQLDIEAKVTPDCVGVRSVNSCENVEYRADVFLFSAERNAACEANACGVCDCYGSLENYPMFGASQWQRQGTTITINGLQMDYCVDGDEMWLGGGTRYGLPRPAYRLRKESCVGTPTPCAERSQKECSSDNFCRLGLCVATSGTQAHCTPGYDELRCNVIQGCAWDPDVCTGEGAPFCAFETCNDQPGCSWGAPEARCGGFAEECPNRQEENCDGGGCTWRPCTPAGSDFGDCELLNPTDCATVTGCTLTNGVCTGSPRCTAVADKVACEKLGCSPYGYCDGVAAGCHTLPVAQCHDVMGCRIEW